MRLPSKTLLFYLRRAVKAQRAAREALCDLRNELSSNQFSEQMEELLEEEVKDLELLGDDTAINLETLADLIRALDSEAP